MTRFEDEFEKRAATFPVLSGPEQAAIVEALRLLRLISVARNVPTDAWRSEAKAAIARADGAR